MRQFSAARISAVALATLTLAGCSLTNPFAQASPSPTPTVAPSDTSSPVNNQGATSAFSRLPVAQDLTFSGPLSGHIDKAVTSCGGTNGQWSAALAQDLNGAALTVYLSLPRDNGPGSYPANNGDGTINIAVHTKSVDYEGASGGFTLATDHRSGTIDAVMTGDLHVSGRYACAAT